MPLLHMMQFEIHRDEHIYADAAWDSWRILEFHFFSNFSHWISLKEHYYIYTAIAEWDVLYFFVCVFWRKKKLEFVWAIEEIEIIFILLFSLKESNFKIIMRVDGMLFIRWNFFLSILYYVDILLLYAFFYVCMCICV